MTCYGRYHRTALDRLPPRIHTYLMRRAQKRHKRLRPCRKALTWRSKPTERQPRMLAHRAWMTEPSAGNASDERSDGRLSRSVLWEPGGEIPPGHPAGSRGEPTRTKRLPSA
jgi:hypothetical protein